MPPNPTRPTPAQVGLQALLKSVEAVGTQDAGDGKSQVATYLVTLQVQVPGPQLAQVAAIFAPTGMAILRAETPAAPVMVTATT